MGFGQLSYVGVPDANRTTRRPMDAGQQVQEGRLSATARTNDGRCLANGQMQLIDL